MTRFLLMVTLVFAVPLRPDAQVTTATLYGIVRDPTGAVLPRATVTLTHERTGLARTSVTDDHGEFALAALPPGGYTLRIELQGFKTRTSQGLQLSPGWHRSPTLKESVKEEASKVASRRRRLSGPQTAAVSRLPHADSHRL